MFSRLEVTTEKFSYLRIKNNYGKNHILQCIRVHTRILTYSPTRESCGAIDAPATRFWPLKPRQILASIFRQLLDSLVDLRTHESKLRDAYDCHYDRTYYKTILRR